MKKFLITPLIMAFAVSTSIADDTAGKAAYATCAACHNADGKGLPLGNQKMAPSLVGSVAVTSDASVLALVILKGIKKEGNEYMGMMGALEAIYTDDQKLAEIMSYVRQSFGNTAGAVTKEEAAKYREQWKDVKEPVTRAKIEELTKKK